MNVQMGDLCDSLQLRVPGLPTAAAKPEPGPEAPKPAPRRASSEAPAPSGKSAGAAATQPDVPGVVDPMQWWGALTKQFTELAATALKDNATGAAKNLAGNMMKQTFDAAGQTLKKAAGMPAGFVDKTARKTVGAARKRAAPRP